MIESCTYPTASQFLEETSELLESDEVRNNLILGLANVLVKEPLRFGSQPFFAAAKKDSNVELAALMTPPHKLILCAANSNDEPYESFCNTIRSACSTIPGVIGSSDTAQRFVKEWTAITAAPSQLAMEMRVYKLTEVRPMAMPNGRARQVRAADTHLIAEWIRQFNKEVFSIGVENAERKAARHIADGTMLLWEDTVPVSMCNRCRETRNGFVVNMVFTPQQYRNKGYATACVTSMCETILISGKKFCSLFTDLSNPTSNSIYQKIGFTPVGDFLDYAFS